MPQWATRARRRRLPDGTLILRPSWASLGLISFPMIPFLTAVSLGSNSGARDLLWPWVGLASVHLIVLVLILTRRRVVLKWDALEQRNLVRSRSVPAADIQAVTVEGNASLTDSLRIWTANRSSFACPALTSADLVLVGDWWLSQRGSAWQPAWAIENPPAPTEATWWT